MGLAHIEGRGGCIFWSWGGRRAGAENFSYFLKGGKLKGKKEWWGLKAEKMKAWQGGLKEGRKIIKGHFRAKKNIWRGFFYV